MVTILSPVFFNWRGVSSTCGSRRRERRQKKLGAPDHANPLAAGENEVGITLRCVKRGGYRGVIGPVKVVRAALQDAASIAGLLIATKQWWRR
jgi:chaperonin GroEL (HSP60 family)